MNSPTKRLYSRLAIAFLALLASSALFILWSFFLNWQHFQNENLQTANWSVAAAIAKELEPLTSPDINPTELARKVFELNRLLPAVSILLLDENGEILEFLPRHFPLSRQIIDVEPIQRFLNRGPNSAQAILGDDPVSQHATGVFSAARIKIGPEYGYLYVFFRSFADNVAASFGAESAAGRTLLLQFAVFLILSSLLGLWVLKRLTRRFYDIIHTVSSWRSGTFSSKVPENGNDEVALLGRTLNEMIEKIQGNLSLLEEKDTRRRELLAAVSHDLRGPVAVMKGHVENLLLVPDLTPEKRTKTFEAISRAVQSLHQLVLELFDLAKFETKEMQPKFSRINLTKICKDLLLAYDALAEERRVQLVLDAPHEELFVVGDHTLLDRVFSNLFANALRYTPADGQIGLRVAPREDEVSITVFDTGAGIPEDQLDKIFDSFYRDEASRADGGAGLGLAIVRRIIELHGGKISVQSAPGRGSEFQFCLKRSLGPDAF